MWVALTGKIYRVLVHSCVLIIAELTIKTNHVPANKIPIMSSNGPRYSNMVNYICDVE